MRTYTTTEVLARAALAIAATGLIVTFVSDPRIAALLGFIAGAGFVLSMCEITDER